MKNLFWIIQSVLIIVIYCCLVHFTFTFFSTWKSVVVVPISIFGGICCFVLAIVLFAYIVRNYTYFECDLFD